MDDDKNILKKDIMDDPKYSEIYNSFEKIFRSNGYRSNDTFDSKAWFIHQDPIFQSFLIKNNPTPQKPNFLVKILTELNENRDLSLLKVKVKNFIYKLTEGLIEYNKVVWRSEDTIKQYDAYQKVNTLTQMIKMLNTRISKQVNPIFNSNVSISLIKLEKFPLGEFDFKLKILEFINDSQNESAMRNSNSSGMINKKSFQLESTVVVRKENEVLMVSPSLHTFKSLDFKLFESKLFDDLFKNYSSSGTTFSNFQVFCHRRNKNEIYQTKLIFFLDMILMYIDDISDVSKENLVKTLHLKVYLDSKDELINKEDGMELVIEMAIEWDDLTRIGILKRVLDIFNELIHTRQMAVNGIDEVLEYFPSLSNSLKAYLAKKTEEKREVCCNRESCCNHCSIF